MTLRFYDYDPSRPSVWCWRIGGPVNPLRYGSCPECGHAHAPTPAVAGSSFALPIPGWEHGYDDLGRPMDPPEVWSG